MCVEQIKGQEALGEKQMRLLKYPAIKKESCHNEVERKSSFDLKVDIIGRLNSSNSYIITARARTLHEALKFPRYFIKSCN